MQLYFIRHAQSENNALWEQTGSSDGRSEDPGLSALGVRQAECLAEFLCIGDPDGGQNCRAGEQKGFGFTHIYSSLMVRAVATGAQIARAMNLPLVAWVDLHEHGGVYLEDKDTGLPVGQAGKTRSFFEGRYPGLVLPGSVGEQGWWNFQPFERDEDRPARARRVLDELLSRHGNSQDRVAMVSHAGFYNGLMGVILGLPVNPNIWFWLNNAAITRLDFHSEHVDLVYQNRVDFLQPDMVS